MTTEQRSLRLNPSHLRIVEQVQAEKGGSFTEAVKQIIEEYAKSQDYENAFNRFFQKLNSQLQSVNGSKSIEAEVEATEILEELRLIGGNIDLICKAIRILGSADSRTAIEIEELYKGTIE